MGIRLACALLKDGYRVVIHDPVALASARKTLGESVGYAETLAECLNLADLVVLTNPYRSMASQLEAEMAKGKAVIDCWRVLPSRAVRRRAPGQARKASAAAPPATMTASESLA